MKKKSKSIAVRDSDNHEEDHLYYLDELEERELISSYTPVSRFSLQDDEDVRINLWN